MVFAFFQIRAFNVPCKEIQSHLKMIKVNQFFLMLEKIQDFFLMSGKRKREDFAPQYPAGGFIPQQDGAGDATPVVFEIEVCLLVFPNTNYLSYMKRVKFGGMNVRMFCWLVPTPNNIYI